MRHTQFFLSGQRIGSHIGSASWNIQHILWLISSFKQGDIGEIFVGFQGRWTSMDSQIFHEVLTRYFSSIVISINFYHVENGDGRQPRILVDNSWIPTSKHVFHYRVSSSRICRDKIKDHKRKVDTNRLVSETYHGKIYYCWILQMFIYSMKKKKKNSKKKANFNCKWWSPLIEHR